MRQEARPREPRELTRSQLSALETILGTLNAATVDLPERGTELTLDPQAQLLDRRRSSRIFFLSGEAGTGKTTVYLSLRGAADRHSRKGSNRSECSIPNQLKEIAQCLDRLSDHLVWLEPITLEEADNPSTNYLAAILARIDWVLEHELKTGPGGERGAQLFDRPKITEALTEFQRLRTDVGLAWDGNLPSRGVHLDPDVFAEEVMRAERARIDINGRFHRVLESLTYHLYPDGKNPLFVLPVDDLSLNPGPSLEILRLLRMISIPRLFILAMGDDSTFEELGFQKVLGRLIGLAGDSAFQIGRQQRVLMARARQLSSQAQRKLIPPGQRASIEALYWDESLNRIGAGPEMDDARARHPLWRGLQGLEPRHLAVPPWRPQQNPDKNNASDLKEPDWTLLEFLAFPGESRINLAKLRHHIDKNLTSEGPTEDSYRLFSKADGHEDAYTGLQILEVPYRHAIDLWVDLPSESKTDETHRTTMRPQQEDGQTVDSQQERRKKDFFRWIVGEALRHLGEQNYMSNLDRERCEEAIRGSWYVDTSLDTSELKAEKHYGSRIQLDARQGQSGSSASLTDGPSIEAWEHRGWRLGPKAPTTHPAFYGAEKRPPGTWSFMPPRPLAWYVLLHDLLVFTPGQDLSGPALTPRWDSHSWAGTLWLTRLLDGRKQSPPAVEASTEDPTSSIWLPWPVPEWRSFWQFDDFLAGWNAIVAVARKELNAPRNNAPFTDDSVFEKLVYWWIRLAADVFLVQNRRCRIRWGQIHRIREHDTEANPSAHNNKPKGSQGRAKVRDNSSRGPEWFNPPAWHELEADLTNILTKSSSEAHRPYREYYYPFLKWLVHLHLITAPEYSLPFHRTDQQQPGLRELLRSKPIVEAMKTPRAERYIRKIRARTIHRFFPHLRTVDALRNASPKSTAWSELLNQLQTDELGFGPGKARKPGKWFPLEEDLEEAAQSAEAAREERGRWCYRDYRQPDQGPHQPRSHDD